MPAPTPAPAPTNTEETKHLEAVILILQQQMTQLAEAQKAQDLKTAQLMQAQDAKVALLEQQVIELTQVQATKCDCNQRLTDMDDIVAKSVSGIEDKLLGLETFVFDMADTTAKIFAELEGKVLDLKEDVSDKFLSLNNLKTQVHALEIKAESTSYGLAKVMVEVKVVAAKVTRLPTTPMPITPMPTRLVPSPPTQSKTGSYPNADRVRTIVMDALSKAKDMQTRVASISTSTSLESHEPVNDLEASSVSKYSAASVITSHRYSNVLTNATMATPLISMDDLQASRCAPSTTNLGASFLADDRFARLEAMFRVQAQA